MRQGLFDLAAGLSATLCAAILGISVLSYFRGDTFVPAAGQWGIAFHSYRGVVTIFRGDFNWYDDDTATFHMSRTSSGMHMTSVPVFISAPIAAILPVVWLRHRRRSRLTRPDETGDSQGPL